jgi:hypothetical protein
MKDGVQVDQKRSENNNFKSFRTCYENDLELVHKLRKSTDRVKYSSENKEKLESKLSLLEQLKNKKIE